MMQRRDGHNEAADLKSWANKALLIFHDNLKEVMLRSAETVTLGGSRFLPL